LTYGVPRVVAPKPLVPAWVVLEKKVMRNFFEIINWDATEQ
jgi:hypothetical protein